MTVPEENRPKTKTTDDVVRERKSGDDDMRSGTAPSGSTMREAMEEAGVKREDYQEE